MRLAIYERLYQFNFHLIEARRILRELGLALKIDASEELCRIRRDLDEARREANRRCCAQMEVVDSRESDGLYECSLASDEVMVRELHNRESAEPFAAHDVE